MKYQMRKLLIRAYCAGYENGHHDTVEGNFHGDGKPETHAEGAEDWLVDEKEILATIDAMAGQAEPVAWVAVRWDQIYWTEDASLSAVWKQNQWNVLEYYAAPVQAVPKWQPIETAPKTLLDLKTVELLGHCPESHEMDPSDQVDIRVIWWEPHKNCWWCDGDFRVQPSHWMPLPAAPITMSKGESL